MSEIDKIIVVAYHIGRVGSSAMMGLLRVAGMNVGNQDRLVGPAPMNPKGFFELQAQEPLLRECYPDIVPGVTDPPSLDLLDTTGKEFFPAYREWIHKEFGHDFPIAIKSPRFLTLPFFFELRQEFDIRVLVMDRKLEKQVESILRVWRNLNDPIKRSASEQIVTNWVKGWKQFGEQVLEHYDFPYFKVTFERILDDPIESMKDIAAFLDITCPSNHQITNWVDRSLVNRNSLPGVKKNLRHRIVKKVRAILRNRL